MKIEELITTLNKLGRLDLSSKPVKQINNYINQIGLSAQIGYTLHPGSTILRARPNKTEVETFTTKDQLSYRPQIYNLDFQRASTPNQTMFYGCIHPSYLGKDDNNSPRLGACFEASDTFRNNRFIANEKITFSRWEVKSDINLMIIIPAVRNQNVDSFMTFMNSELDKVLQKDPELAQRTRLINHYFSQEFSKTNIRFDYDYMISALYTDMIVKSGFDGVLYPSVKSQGKAYNVCITKSATDNNLKLVAAGEGRILKVGYLTQTKNEAEVRIDDDSKSFSYTKIKEDRTTEEIISDLYKGYNVE
jgi:hypothetical protein